MVLEGREPPGCHYSPWYLGCPAKRAMQGLNSQILANWYLRGWLSSLRTKAIKRIPEEPSRYSSISPPVRCSPRLPEFQVSRGFPVNAVVYSVLDFDVICNVKKDVCGYSRRVYCSSDKHIQLVLLWPAPVEEKQQEQNMSTAVMLGRRFDHPSLLFRSQYRQ